MASQNTLDAANTLHLYHAIESSMLLVPSVHRLPVELLSHIFVDLDSIRIHEDSIGRKYVSDKGPHLLEITAARVCKRWRSVALTTSVLWSFISVGDDTRHVEAYIDACATNSGNHPLTLWCISKEFLTIFLSRLLPHCLRWESLNIDGGKNIDFSALSSQYEFRILRAVKLRWFLPLKSGILDFLTNAPQLKVLEIWDSMTEDSLRIPNLTNLAEVYFHADEPCTCTSIFGTIAQSCASLQIILLSFINFPQSELDRRRPVVVPALRCLYLEYSCHVFTRFIVAPALIKLEFRDSPIAESFCDSIDVLMSHPQADPRAL
ncbi:hypothetical protein GGG16DRAFT_118009 [Schizophyllum commune]